MSAVQDAKPLLKQMVKPAAAAGESQAEGRSQSMSIRSSAFKENRPIPQRYAGEGANVSPPLEISGVPAGTRELALICEDPDAPMPQPYVHWIIYGLPPQTASLPEGVPTVAEHRGDSAHQAQNSNKTIGYTGPMPPPGHGPHHYHFQLFALDRSINAACLGKRPDRDALVEEMNGHVLAVADYVGTYERKP